MKNRDKLAKEEHILAQMSNEAGVADVMELYARIEGIYAAAAGMLREAEVITASDSTA